MDNPQNNPEIIMEGGPTPDYGVLTEEQLSAPYAMDEYNRHQDMIDLRTAMMQDVPFTDIVSERFKTFNPLVNVMQMAHDNIEDNIYKRRPSAQGFNRSEYLEQRGVDESDEWMFRGIDSPEGIERRLKRMESRNFAQELSAENPVAGFIASIGAEVLTDPANLAVGLGVASKLKAGVSALPISRAAVITAAEAGGSEALAQTALQLNQPERSDAEAVFSTIVSAGFGGVLGAGAAAWGKSVGGMPEARMNRALEDSLRSSPTVDDSLHNVYDFSLSAAETPQGLKNLAAADTELIENPAFTAAARTAGKLAPGVRLSLSQSPTIREFRYQLLSTNLETRTARTVSEEGEFGTLGQAADVEIAQQTGRKEFMAFKARDENYAEYKKAAKAAGKSRKEIMSEEDFGIAVTFASRRGDDIDGADYVSPNAAKFYSQIPEEAKPFINKTSQSLRKNLFDPDVPEIARIKDVEVDEILPETAISYMTRAWDTQQVSVRKGEFSQILKDMAKRQMPMEVDKIKAKLARGDLEKAQIEELENDLLFFQNPANADQYAEDIAQEVIEKMNGYDPSTYEFLKPKARGPAKDRVLMINDVDAEDFLINDFDALVRKYSRISSAEIALHKRFGTSKFKDFYEAEVRPKLAAEEEDFLKPYDKEIKSAKTDMEKNKAIQKRAKALDRYKKEVGLRMHELETIWDKVRGTWRDKTFRPESAVARASVATRQLTMLSYLSSVTLSSVTDIAMPVITHGIAPVVKDGMVPMIRGLTDKAFLKKMSRFKNEIKDWGLAIEGVTNIRASQIANLGDPSYVQPNTMFGRAVNSMTGKFGKFVGMNWWNDAVQEMAASVDVARFSKLALKEKKLSKKDASWLSRLGVSSDDMARIGEQMRLYGSKDEYGRFLPNSRAWDDPELADKFELAMFQSNRNQILTRSEESTPLYADTIHGKVMTQFMTHTFSANTRLMLAGMQRADAEFYQGLIALSTLGMMRYYFDKVGRGEEPSEDWKVWLWEGVDRSSIVPLLTLVNDRALEPLDIGASQLFNDPTEAFKYSTPEQALGSMAMGASGSYVADAARAAKALTSLALTGEAKKSDIKKITNPLPFITLPLINTLAKEFEDGLAENYGE